MSNLSDFLPSTGGGSAPLNAVTARYSAEKTITDEDGSVWLKGGNTISENLENYPDATKSFSDIDTPIAEGATNDLNLLSSTLTGLHSFDVKPDGTKLYCFWNNSVHQFDMPTPWDVTSITSLENVKALGNSGTFNANSNVITPDGRFIYNTNVNNTDGGFYIREMSTPWDTSTVGARVTRSTINFNGYTTYEPESFLFSENGDKMYITRTNSAYMDEYYLSVPFDAASSYSNQLPLPSNEYPIERINSDSRHLVMSKDGTFLVGGVGYTVSFWKLDIPWDFSTVKTIKRISNYIGLSISSDGVDFNRDFTKAISMTGTIAQSYNVTPQNYIGVRSASSPYDYVRIL